MSNGEVAEAMMNHHAQMIGELKQVVSAVTSNLVAWDEGRDKVVDYLRAEILPHAATEESTVYRMGAQYERLTALIDSMVFEHAIIRSVMEALQLSSTREECIVLAAQASKLFSVHAEKENRFIIADLASRAEVDLRTMLGNMRHSLAH